MTFLRACLTALPLLAMTGVASFAADATPEGAAKLTETFQKYLGKTPGVVTVTPSGAVYDVRLDPAPFLAAIPAGEGTATASPLVMQLTDNGDGTWGVTHDQAWDMKIAAPDLNMTLTLGSYKGTGTFDSGLGVFTTATADFTDLKMDQTTAATTETPEAHVSYSVASGHVDTTGKAGATGGADVAQKFTMKQLVETISAPMEPGAPPVDISLTADSYDLDSTINGLRANPLLDLIAFFVAHPSEVELKAGQEDLRGGLRTTMPLFDHLGISGVITNVAAQTPIGPVTMTSLGVNGEMNGIVKDGMAREALSIDGLALPPGLLPEWAAPLVPKQSQLDLKVTGFDLASPADAIITAFDLNKDEPLDQAFLDSLLPQLLPTGAVDLTLAHGETVSPAYTLGYEGAMQAGPNMMMPTGKAKISLKGYDAIVAAMNGAPPEIGQQMLPALTLVRGMAMMEGDTLVWDIDASTPGKLLVNGNDIGPMLGQP